MSAQNFTTGNVIPFSAPATLAVPLPLPLRIACGPVLRFYDVPALARLIGLIGPKVTPRRRIDTLRRLVADAGLPAPHTHRWRKGKLCRGAASVCAGSLWDAAKVEAWLESPEPGAPGNSAHPERRRGTPTAPADWREEMRARADRLATGGR